MKRITYFDGLRGLACLQVVIDHYAQSFSPVNYARIGFFGNGECAVDLFFLMSGFVLTGSFKKFPSQIFGHATRRLLRLGVPSLIAVPIAAVLFRIGLHHAQIAAAISQSDWLAPLVAVYPLSNLTTVHIGIWLLFGPHGIGLFSWSGLPDQLTNINPPLWTISVEIWGSFWVLFLVWLRDRSQPVYIVTLAASVYLIGLNELALFTNGHLCSAMVGRYGFKRTAKRPATGWWGAALILEGILLSTGHALDPADTLLFLPPGLLAYYPWFHWQVEFGAVMIFIGVLLMPNLHSVLDRWLPQYLGRLSFSIYLLHYPILIAVGSFSFLVFKPLGGIFPALLAFIIGLAVTLVLATWFERMIDVPVIAWSRKLRFSPEKLSPKDTIVP
jgi:peptidoglycan/LPS O-acetylase OafA/YrhL